MRGMVKRGHREGEDSTRGGPSNQVVRGGEERGDLEGGALVLTNDRIIGCRERERASEQASVQSCVVDLQWCHHRGRTI